MNRQPRKAPIIRPSKRQIDGILLDLPCQENSGKTVYDLSGHDNHGTLNGDVSLANGALVFGSTGNPYVSIGARPSLDMQMFKNLGNSGDLDFHQGLGVNTVSNEAILLHTPTLQRVTLGYPWTQLQSISFGGAILGNSIQHTNDGNYYNGKFYFVADQWNAGATETSDLFPSYWCVYNADTLEAESATDISALGIGVTGSFLDGDAGLIYCTGFYTGTVIRVLNYPALTLNRVITLDKDLHQLQGVTKKGNLLYVSGAAAIYRVKLDGTVLDSVQNSINEGLDYTTELLYAADEHAGSGWGDASIWTLEPRVGAGGYTCSMWVNSEYLPSESPSGFIRWINTDDIAVGLYYQASAGGSLILKMGNFSSRPTVAQAGNIVKDAWQHFLFTYDHGGDSGVATAKIYVNGVEKASETGDPQELIPITWRFQLGSNGFSITDSKMRDVQIFNHVLTANEIRRVYEEGL